MSKSPEKIIVYVILDSCNSDSFNELLKSKTIYILEKYLKHVWEKYDVIYTTNIITDIKNCPYGNKNNDTSIIQDLQYKYQTPVSEIKNHYYKCLIETLTQINKMVNTHQNNYKYKLLMRDALIKKAKVIFYMNIRKNEPNIYFSKINYSPYFEKKITSGVTKIYDRHMLLFQENIKQKYNDIELNVIDIYHKNMKNANDITDKLHKKFLKKIKIMVSDQTKDISTLIIKNNGGYEKKLYEIYVTNYKRCEKKCKSDNHTCILQGTHIECKFSVDICEKMCDRRCGYFEYVCCGAYDTPIKCYGMILLKCSNGCGRIRECNCSENIQEFKCENTKLIICNTCGLSSTQCVDEMENAINICFVCNNKKIINENDCVVCNTSDRWIKFKNRNIGLINISNNSGFTLYHPGHRCSNDQQHMTCCGKNRNIKGCSFLPPIQNNE